MDETTWLAMINEAQQIIRYAQEDLSLVRRAIARIGLPIATELLNIELRLGVARELIDRGTAKQLDDALAAARASHSETLKFMQLRIEEEKRADAS